MRSVIYIIDSVSYGLEYKVLLFIKAGPIYGIKAP